MCEEHKLMLFAATDLEIVLALKNHMRMRDKTRRVIDDLEKDEGSAMAELFNMIGDNPSRWSEMKVSFEKFVGRTIQTIDILSQELERRGKHA